MIEERYQVQVCLLYDFKQGRTVSESHHTIVNVFSEGVITRGSCQNWFKCFQDGYTSLKNYKTRKIA